MTGRELGDRENGHKSMTMREYLAGEVFVRIIPTWRSKPDYESEMADLQSCIAHTMKVTEMFLNELAKHRPDDLPSGYSKQIL